MAALCVVMFPSCYTVLYFFIIFLFKKIMIYTMSKYTDLLNKSINLCKINRTAFKLLNCSENINYFIEIKILFYITVRQPDHFKFN